MFRVDCIAAAAICAKFIIYPDISNRVGCIFGGIKDCSAVVDVSLFYGAQVAQALASGDPREILVYHKSSNIEMSRGHMACLKGLNWLNDEVMNMYMGLLLVRVHPTLFPAAG